MVTGTMVRVLNSTQQLLTTHYYDEDGSSIQTIESNIKSGTDTYTKRLHWDGRLLASRELRNIPGANVTNFTIETRYAFDALRRVTHTYKKWAGSVEKLISTIQYDAFGRVGGKRLSPDFNGHFTGIGPAGGGLESLQYKYNIQGSLVGINKPFALKEAGYNKWGNFFGMYFGYTGDPTGVFSNVARLNGQLRGIVWNTQGDDRQRKYEYAYDNAGRLIAANFSDKPLPTNAWANTSLNFSTTNLAYTLNGNLTTLLNMGVQIGNATPVVIDQLAYTYNISGRSNRLIKVLDNTTATTVNGTQGDFKKGPLALTATDYTYDGNGNTITDLNKGQVNAAGANTAGILYNHLDKPVEVNIDGKGRVKFTYDANGSRLKREFISIDATKGTKVTWYFGSLELEEVVGGSQAKALELKNIYFEEGRIRVVTPQASSNTYDALSLAGNISLPGGKQGSFDYFITDHRSDVRMILTEETQWEYVTATSDDARQSTENNLFSFPAGTRVIKGEAPGWSTNINNGSSTHVVKVNQGNPVGSARLLKVMAGDLVGATTKYFYPAPVTNAATPSPVNSVLSALSLAIGGSPTTSAIVKGATGAINTSLSATTAFITHINSNTNNTTENKPKAYLKVLFFDERFNFVSEGSTQARVFQPGDGASPIALLNIKAPKNGYCLVYVSNESPTNVFFDELQVRHDRGRILEENHYYPYGLKIAALSSKSFAAPQNNYQYQGDYSEFDDDLGWNDFMLRSYDPQIGRFLQHDPYDQFASGYVGMGNDPGNMVDPTGGWGDPITGALRQVACPGSGGGNFLKTLTTVTSILGMANNGAKVLGLTVRNGALSQWHVGQGGNIFKPSGLPRGLRFGLRAGLIAGFLLSSDGEGQGQDLRYYRQRKKTERDREFIERTIWRYEWGSDGEDEYYGDDPTGQQFRTTPFSPDDKPPVDPYGRDTYYIYETLRQRKGKVRPYYGITKLRGRGGDGRYGSKTLEGMNMSIIGFTYTKKMAQGIEQNLIELNSDGGRPSRSERIDNLDNSLDPRRVDYPIFKFMGGQWLDYFYPKWREMGTPGQRGQFLRPIKN